ncbi:protein kinase domain-containing protein [Sphaerisporangium perillae]|uniref:protein kinase domain-containing protein n=1 Tax=Sphaerisporangium perillae TaxID=2935860 RepID=UPI0020109059|nr:protein kinase [Sphaerisporangium perillae]
MMSGSGARLVNSRYRLMLRLGRGGMGNVWLAADERLGRHVALKELVMAENGEPLSVRRERALREARAAAGIEHPCVVDIYDVFEERGRPWIVMAYIKGRSLRDLIEDRTLGERELAEIGIRVLGALDATHSAGVLHRDVKPANIVIGEAGKVFLVDFGIARIGGESTLTAQNGFIGTLEFMAPERIEGRPLKPSSDLWSLGVTFFYALEGYSPFRRDDLLATMRAVTDHSPPEAARPGPLADAIVRLLHKDPDQRMNARELTLTLRSIIDGTPAGPEPRVPVKPAPSKPTPPKPYRPTPPESHKPMAPESPRPVPPKSPRPVAPESPNLTGLDPEKAARLVSGMSAGSAARSFASLSPEAAREVLTRVESRVAGAVLLAMPRSKAASILTVIPAKATGGLLGRMAASPQETASVLQMLKAAQAGRAVDYMDLDEAAALLTAMRPGEAARILAHTHARTAAGIIGVLATGPAAAPLVEAMAARSVTQACGVLCYVSPATVSALLKSLPGSHADQLLNGLDATTRAQVLRHLGRS